MNVLFGFTTDSGELQKENVIYYNLIILLAKHYIHNCREVKFKDLECYFNTLSTIRRSTKTGQHATVLVFVHILFVIHLL